MFESVPARSRPLVFYVDPWSVDYGSSLDLEHEDEDEEGNSADPLVETEDWQTPILPAPAPRPRRMAFVDGVQRVEVWGRVDAGDRLVEAALASVAVGASICAERSAEVSFELPARVLAVGGGNSLDGFDVPVGRAEMRFEPVTSQRGRREGVLDAIRIRRAEMERRLADSLTSADTLVVLDGRLSFDPGPATPVVGLAKTIHRLYLPEPQRPLVFRLGAGERTPVFQIQYGQTTRYSWFLRLPNTRPIHHALAGVVRLETPEIGRGRAIELANLTSFHLPAFASRPEHDPRAPQNLLPVGGLERRLRHEMGDPKFIRRAIEDHLARQFKEATT